MHLSVVVITFNEEANLARTLASVQPLVENGQGEIIIVDSHSTDRTVEIAKSFGAKVFVEDWKGFAAQKNSAIDKAAGDWILSLDADEEVEPELANEILLIISAALEWQKHGMPGSDDPGSKELRDRVFDLGLDEEDLNGFLVPRKNFFLGRRIKYGGYWPDSKPRLFRRGKAKFEDRLVHEDAKIEGVTSSVDRGAFLHYAYPTLSSYIEHMNRYSTLGAEMAVANGYRGFSFINIVIRPVATFVYNYIFRLGFLDGREGLLLHVYHSIYVSWKYAKAWEMKQSRLGRPSGT